MRIDAKIFGKLSKKVPSLFSDEILSFYCLSMVDTIRLGMKEKCPLCQSDASLFYVSQQHYFRCPNCRAIFMSRQDLPDSKSEKERYELHSSDTQDAGYRKFVSPITNAVLETFSKEDKGLDFGAGHSAIISAVLRESGYDIANYDPYFHNYEELLSRQYDYITSCEVIEHFYSPKKEFQRLREMLLEGGRLYLMTDIYDESIDFSSWYYKLDPTHVFFYTQETFAWICDAYAFKDFECHKRLITFSL
jgi:Zn-finger nucleic acid-binding protein